MEINRDWVQIQACNIAETWLVLQWYCKWAKLTYIFMLVLEIISAILVHKQQELFAVHLQDGCNITCFQMVLHMEHTDLQFYLRKWDCYGFIFNLVKQIIHNSTHAYRKFPDSAIMLLFESANIFFIFEVGQQRWTESWKWANTQEQANCHHYTLLTYATAGYTAVYAAI